MNKTHNISNLIEEGEGYLVEFKESPKDIEKDVCAFANASGGTIYLGITDGGDIKSLELTNKLKSQIISTVRNCDPPPKIEVEKVGNIIAVRVSESQNKPVRAPNGFFLRMGATSQKLSRDEILSFAVSETKLLFDNQLYVKETTDACLSTRRVEVFRQRAKLDIDLDNKQLLANLGCIKFQNNKSYMTHAGVLLFGNDPQKIFPQATLTVLEMEDTSTINEQKIFRGSLIEQVEDAFYFLKSRLKSKPKIESLRREDVLELPEFVIRELLVNAVIHRDYFERSADVVVKIFPNYLEFSNPGKISDKLPLDKLYGRSFRRNPMIADLFFHANYIDRAGTGLLRVSKALKERGLPPLNLSEEGPFFIAVIRRETFADSSLFNSRQLEIFSWGSDMFPFSTKEYSSRFGISERMARLDIQDLVRKSYLTPIRSKQRVKYNRNTPR